MNPKYVLCPGHVVSVNDNEMHHTSAEEIARLYGVPFDQCLIFDKTKPGALHGLESGKYKGLIPLTPRSDGDYRIPEKTL